MNERSLNSRMLIVMGFCAVRPRPNKRRRRLLSMIIRLRGMRSSRTLVDRQAKYNIIEEKMITKKFVTSSPMPSINDMVQKFAFCWGKKKSENLNSKTNL